MPYNELVAKRVTCGCSLPPADNISPKGKTGLHSKTVLYDREYVACHIEQIGVLRGRFLSLPPPAG